MKNKKAIIGLGAIATLLFGVASSIAYLTDTDTTVNVMTVGNVKIEQLEYERVLDANGNATSELQPYSQLKPIVPAVYKTADKKEDWSNALFDWSSVGAEGKTKVFHEDMKNVIDKFVLVENTGKKDAYVRTIVAIEEPAALVVGYERIHINYNDTQYALEVKGSINIEGVRYAVLEFTHNEVLEAGQTSLPSLAQVYLDPKTTSEEVELFGDTFEILAISQAVQTDGFDSAKEALDEAFGKTAEKAAEWFGGLTVVVKNGSEEEMAQQLTEALEKGQNVVVKEDVDIVTVNPKEENGVSTYDSNGATVTMNGDLKNEGTYGYLAFLPGKGKDANVSNVNVTGTGFVEVGHYGEGGGTYIVDNMTIKDMTTTLEVENGPDKVGAAFAHYGTATLNNCVMTGTVSGAKGYPAYDAGFVNGTKTTINGGEYGSMYIWNQAHVTIKDAKVGTIVSSAITKSNLGKLTISSGTTVDTIKLVPGSYKPSLVIEDGATVGKIIYNGNTYNVEQWKALVL